MKNNNSKNNQLRAIVINKQSLHILTVSNFRREISKQIIKWERPKGGPGNEKGEEFKERKREREKSESERERERERESKS